jgi:hypothetical protein
MFQTKWGAQLRIPAQYSTVGQKYLYNIYGYVEVFVFKKTTEMTFCVTLW